MDISGRWQCVLDTKNKAFATINWTSPEVKTVNLPGSTDIWQFGHADTPNITTRLSRKHRFEGAIWLKRDITLSKKNRSELFRITLERTHWKAEAWLDGIALGSADSLSAPNCFWCPSDTEEGVHTLVLRIDNTPQVDIGGWAQVARDRRAGERRRPDGLMLRPGRGARTWLLRDLHRQDGQLPFALLHSVAGLRPG